MAKVKKIVGYDEFIANIDKLTETVENVNVLFTGKKDETGRSWCPDCNDGNNYFKYYWKKKIQFKSFFIAWIITAEPFVNKYCIEKAEPNSLFVVVDVGDRPTYVFSFVVAFTLL